MGSRAEWIDMLVSWQVGNCDSVQWHVIVLSASQMFEQAQQNPNTSLCEASLNISRESLSSGKIVIFFFLWQSYDLKGVVCVCVSTHTCTFEERLLLWSPGWHGTYHIDPAGLQLTTVFLSPLECRDYRHAPPSPASMLLFLNIQVT